LGIIIGKNQRERGMKLSGHVIGLLKEYMHDLVEQASQEAYTQQSFGFTPAPYRPDQAISDLLAILDDRIESEGVQVGLPDGFLHAMWTFCNEAQAHILDQVWMESNAVATPTKAITKATIRRLTYQALIDHLETADGCAPA
jgi:hypothetical protein